MTPKKLLLVLTVLALFAGAPGVLALADGPDANKTGAPAPRRAAAIQTPVLKWQNGGCFSSWCETGWYSSPAVMDVDDDGQPEVIAAAYSVFALNGEDGSEQWMAHRDNLPGGRVWPGVVTADIDNDGQLEIVTGHGSGYLNVLNRDGSIRWTAHPVDNELRGLAVYDLDADDTDDTMELVVSSARGSKTNTWIYEHNNTLRPGWPRLTSDAPESAWGTYNDNPAAADIDGDGQAEIVVPSDVHSVCAYKADGTQISANAIYHPHAGDTWGQVGVHVDHAVDLRGYAHCGTEHRPNFAGSPATLVDVNNDGVLEIIVVGNVYNCGTSPYTDLYEMPFIFNADRTRWAGSGYDWEVIPVPDGSAAPLSENYNVIENTHPNPVVADLDGDGLKEILYPSYDGRLHAYWLDKTEHGNWPLSVYSAGEGVYRFATEPVVADLDNDGHAEVIFGTWVQKGTHKTGNLIIADYLGNILQSVALPAAYGSPDWNGALAAPTLDNIDGDSDLEVILNTAHSGVVAYDLPGSANAQILWGTGRGSYQRSGSLLQGSLNASDIKISNALPAPGEVVTYTVTLRNNGPELSGVRLTDTLDSKVSFNGYLWASGGQYGQAGGVITWTGAVSAAAPVTLRFGASVSPAITRPTAISNALIIDDGLGNTLERQAAAIVNALSVYLPLVMKN